MENSLAARAKLLGRSVRMRWQLMVMILIPLTYIIIFSYELSLLF